MLGSQFIRKDRGFRARHLFPVLLLHSGVSCLNSPLCPYPPGVTPPDFMSHLSDPCALFLDWVPNLDLFAPPHKHFGEPCYPHRRLRFNSPQLYAFCLLSHSKATLATCGWLLLAFPWIFCASFSSSFSPRTSLYFLPRCSLPLSLLPGSCSMLLHRLIVPLYPQE